MKSISAYSKIVAFLTICSGLLALLCLVLLAITFANHPEAISDPVQMLQIKDVNIPLLRGSMFADLAGYYLLLLPLIYYLRPYLRQKSPWADLATVTGIAYVLGGSIGAVITAEVVSRLYTAYYLAGPVEQEAIRVVFRAFTYLVYEGLWNVLGSLFSGIWWLLTGYILLSTNQTVGRATFVLGVFTLLDVLGHVIGIRWLAEIGLNVYLGMAPVWAIWMGVRIWKGEMLPTQLPKSHQMA
jgi:hypothetical protein